MTVETIAAETDVGRATGRFTKGVTGNGQVKKPLIVLIHGGGTNATYFDNESHSIPKDFNDLGYAVLNVNRAGYGGNPIPKSKTPIFDTAPLYSQLIQKVYKERSNGLGGVILIGHSLGGITSLVIAALEGNNLPLLGVSAMGSVPSKLSLNVEFAKALRNSTGDRVPVNAEPTAEDLRRFLGLPDYFDSSKLPVIQTVLEEGIRSELIEWTADDTYDRFRDEIASKVTVPLQYLAGEVELHWDGLEDGKPLFDEAAALFNNVPSLDAEILPGGAHNFEFSTNSQALKTKRIAFVQSLTSSR